MIVKQYLITLLLIAALHPAVITITGWIDRVVPTDKAGVYLITVSNSRITSALIFDRAGIGQPTPHQGVVFQEVVLSSGDVYSDVYIGGDVYSGQL